MFGAAFSASLFFLAGDLTLTSPSSETPSEASAPLTPAPAGDHLVEITLDAPVGASLMRRNAFGWGSVCTAPCRTMVSPDLSYRIEGMAMRSTRTFKLEAQHSRVRLRVQPAKTGSLVVGSILGYGGLVTLSLGLQVLLASFIIRGESGENIKFLVPMGLTMSGIGVLGMGVGIPLMIRGARSRLDIESLPQPVLAMTWRRAF